MITIVCKKSQLSEEASIKSPSADYFSVMSDPRASHTHREASHKSGSVRSRFSRHSEASHSSSYYKAKAKDSEAKAAAAEARLQAELKAKDLEEELALLELQQKQELLTRKRQISEAKLRAEVDAERAQQQIYEEAAALDDDNNLKGSLLRPPSQISKQVVQKKRDTPESNDIAKVPEKASPTIAETITAALSYSRLPFPEPIVFSGDPLQYADWKVAFNGLIGNKLCTPLEKLHLLRKYVSGEAKESVSGYFKLQSADAYSQALATLEKEFGNEDLVEDGFRDKLEQWPKIDGKNGKALQKYGYFLNQCQAAMQSIQGLSVLNDKRENKKYIKVLPDWLANRWVRHVTKAQERTGCFPPFSKYAEFINHEAKVSCNSLRDAASKSSQSSSTRKNDTIKPKTTLKTEAENIADTNITNVQEVCGYCEKLHHKITECRTLSKLTKDQKEEHVKAKNLCFGCLEAGHQLKNCTNRAKCQKCDKYHPTSMHHYRPVIKSETTPFDSQPEQEVNKPNISKTKEVSPPEASKESTHQITHSSTSSSQNEICSMTVPVWLSTVDKPHEILVYAMLDSQSDSSYIVEHIAKQLEAPMTSTTLNLTTMTSQNQTVCSNKIKNLQIRPYKSVSDPILLPTLYTQKNIPVNRNHISSDRVAAQWHHLAHVRNQLPSQPQDIPVGLLIGYDCAQAFKPKQCISGGENEPFAVETPIGWVIMGGSAPETKGTHVISHKLLSEEIRNNDKQPKPITLTHKQSKAKPKNEITELLNILSTDFEDSGVDETPMSLHDKKFIEILSNNIHINQKGYITMPLPMKCQPPQLNTKSHAMHRLNLLQKKFRKNTQYKEQYYEFMHDIIAKGEAVKVPPEELDQPITWYLPHFGVVHPKKPSKLRVVFDASAQVQGTCLNDYLLQGPDHVNNLAGILMRFRKERVAIMADIQKMFHQFRVQNKHQDYLRFLWYDEQGNVTTYRMCVHLFGAKSSPACATFGLRYLAEDVLATSGKQTVHDFIKYDFYVDDGLTSVSSIDEAQSLIEESRSLCQKANIRLHKFVSNKLEALSNLPETEVSTNLTKVDLTADDKTNERALGVQWNVNTDTFQFPTLPLTKPNTRRGILSTVASLFDPLGYVSPIVLEGKILLQSLCKLNIGWDEAIDAEVQKKWTRWKEGLAQLEDIHMPRCYKPEGFGTIAKAELHSFSDASTVAYGQCTYLRLVNDSGNCHVSLVMSKSRVAPLKVISVPRLELQAACTSIDVSKEVKKQLKIDNLEEFFWTDSKVVLGYINNDARRFHVFVANRVQRIRNHSNPGQWNYVSTETNPADIASRGATATALVDSDWFSGPKMLWSPSIPVTLPWEGEVDLQDPEIKVIRPILNTQKAYPDLCSRMSKFSRWESARRAIARLQTAINRKKQQVNSVSAIQKAETIIIKSVQQNYYAEEIDCVIKNEPVKKSSALYKLCPIIDEFGVLRVGGRLQASSFSYAERHPILLPKSAHVSSLIVKYYHEQTAHQGRGFTLAKLRAAGYWVIGGHSKIASVIHHCVTCRRNRGKPLEQQMAPLPADRVEPAAPFSYVGCDCFGPFIVRDGRKEQKRYGLVVTCMASRAVHIELLDDLSADVFLNALRTVVAIRGAIRQIRCDQGTNFVGAMNELAKPNNANSTLVDKCKAMNIEFVFNPPHASHMGGAWERQIRTIRNVLKAVLQRYGGRLSTTALRTALYEVMSIINCRPLGLVSEEQVPLTPNMLITMKSDIILPPPGRFEDADTYSRKQWRKVQKLANDFWQRYRKEYLSQLQSRNKWVKKHRDIQTGDIVIVNEGDCVRNDWKLATVTECILSNDGHARSVKLLLGNPDYPKQSDKRQYLTRPITKIIVLVEAQKDAAPINREQKH